MGQMLVSYRAARVAVGELLDCDALAGAAGLHPELVRRLYRLGLVVAEEHRGGEPLFAAAAAVRRLRRATRLHADLGVGWAALGLVVDLLERVEALESRLRELEDEGE